MKYLYFSIVLIIFVQSCAAQKNSPLLLSLCSCEHLNKTGEDRFKKSYQGFPCLLDFVNSQISDSLLLKFVGKNQGYVALERESCEEESVVFYDNNQNGNFRIRILKNLFLMSEHQIDYDTTVLEGYDFDLIKPTGIEGRKVVGVEIKGKEFIEIQNVISEIRIERKNERIIIPIEKHFLVFNANFCKRENYTLKPIEIFDIGDNKLAVYIHGNPRYKFQSYSDYITKIIIDKEKGYIGTVFLKQYDLRAYGWTRCKDFQGF